MKAPMLGSSRSYHRKKARAGVKAWSKFWGRYLRTTVGVKDTAKVFHSFRHGVTDALRRGRVDFELREALVGHSQGSTVSGGYGASEMLARWGVEAMQDAVAKISYPGLDLSRVRPFAVGKRTRGNK
jgi:integrase